MKEQLANIMKRFKESPTSLESYRAISDFMEAILKMKNFEAFDAVVGKEHETIQKMQKELIINKSNYTNEYRNSQSDILHQMDINFCLRNLNDVRFGLQSITDKTEYFQDSIYWMFRRFKPDDPMPEADKWEYGHFMNKVYKKVIPFLEINNNQDVEEIKVKSYDETNKILNIGNYKIQIAKNEGNNNAHELMAYIFIDNKDNLKDKFYYSEIAEKRFEDDNYKDKGKKAHEPYSGACDRINERIKDQTDGKIKEFLIKNYSSKGHVQVNPDYL